MITLKDFITSGGQYEYLWNDESWEPYKKDAQKTVSRSSELLSRMGLSDNAVVSSGFRTISINKAVGGSANSKHLYCQAIDLWDPELKIGRAAAGNEKLLAELGLWMESLESTHKDPQRLWVHFQIIAPRSGNIIFHP